MSVTYKLSINYAADPDGVPQVHPGLTAAQVEQYVRPEVGFLSDMLILEGRGVVRLTVEVER